MKWFDINGNPHEVPDCVTLENAMPNCQYLLPCGVCTISSELKTCSLLRENKHENND